MDSNIIRKPIFLTEKASRLREDQNKVVFEVVREANKIQIREAIQQLFGVSVLDVNTNQVRGKSKRKKAIVTLKAGESIQFFDEEKASEGGAADQAATDGTK
jgi:large subunit ribosomal protein L23